MKLLIVIVSSKVDEFSDRDGGLRNICLYFKRSLVCFVDLGYFHKLFSSPNKICELNPAEKQT